ncbi:MAG: hypothetical protein AAF730_17025 [Bacteroidota bacterium]
MTLIENRFARIHTADLTDGDLKLTVILYDTVSPPPFPEPVCVLVLHGVRNPALVNAEVLEQATICEVEQTESEHGFVVELWDVFEKVACIECEWVSQSYRAFESNEWLSLIESYDRVLNDAQDEVRLVKAIVNRVRKGIQQRQERAIRIMTERPEDSLKAREARGRLSVLREISNLLEEG